MRIPIDMRAILRVKPSLPLALSLAVLAAAALVSDCVTPLRIILLTSTVILGLMPFWREGDQRLSLDRIPATAMFAACSPESAYLLSFSAFLFSTLLYYSIRDRRPDLRRALLDAALSPAVTLGLASIMPARGWLSFALLFLGAGAGGLLAKSISTRMPRAILHVRPWSVSSALSLPLSMLVSHAASAGDMTEAVVLLGSAAAFSTLAKTRLDAQKTYVELAFETALQNNLAAELSTASSVGQYMGLLEAYLHSAAGETTILSRQESGGWTGWTENRQHAVVDRYLPPASAHPPGSVAEGFHFGGAEGTLLGLSSSPDMLMFVPGRAGKSLAAMDPVLRKNLVSLITHSWKAVGHSMAIEEAFIAAAMMLARLADSKDDYTHGHSIRVSRLSQKIGRELELSPDMLRTLMVGALLHDLGKVAIPVEILTKRGLLTREERGIIERHPAEGTRILGTLGGYDMVRSIVQSHHERLDGKGYPLGLSGRDIPFPARIVAVADTFDAITSRRSYRENSDVRTAVDAINAGAGTQFDARIVSALVRVLAGGDQADGAGA